MLFDFYKYLNHSINTNGMNDYINCYSTFLMSRKDLPKNILKHRMNILIDVYLNDKNPNYKYDYYYYYLNNFKDSYFDKETILHKKLLKSIDITEDFDSDVKDHYKFMITKNPIEPPIDYDEIDKQFYEEELLKQKEKEELEAMKNYNEYYDDDDDYYFEDYDYYEDIDYYNDDYDDYEYK